MPTSEAKNCSRCLAVAETKPTIWTPTWRGAITEFIETVDVLEVDLTVAFRFGTLRGELLDGGITIPNLDGLIAATALVGDFLVEP
jgi:predicted nucleic acid-binding protein